MKQEVLWEVKHTEMKYQLLSNIISVKNYSAKEHNCVLEKFVTERQCDESKCIITVKEISESSYGIESIENANQIQNVFFSKKDYIY